MRRPTKELFDAVTGEGKYARRSSQAGTPSAEGFKVKRESDGGEFWKATGGGGADASENDNAPQSPLAGKTPPSHQLPDNVVMERRRRPSSLFKAPERLGKGTEDPCQPADADTGADTSGSGDVDVYEFTSSSPHTDKEEVVETKKTSRRQTLSSRRTPSATDGDKGGGSRERSSARRRSMMV
jgi:hypothetical protein